MKLQKQNNKLKLNEAKKTSSYKAILGDDLYNSLTKLAREQIDNGNITQSVIDQINSTEILYKLLPIVEDDKTIFKYLNEKLLARKDSDIYGNGELINNLDKESLKLLLNELTLCTAQEILSKTCYILEFVKKLINQAGADKVTYELLYGVTNLIRKNKLSVNELLRTSNLFNDRIYNEQDPEDQLYWIYLYIFFRDADENNLSGYKYLDGSKFFNEKNSTFDYWLNRSGLNAQKVKKLFSKISNSDRQKSKNSIPLQTWLEISTDWKDQDILKNLLEIVNKSSISASDKNIIKTILTDIFKNKDDLQKFYATKISSDITKNDVDKITDYIIKYIDKIKDRKIDTSKSVQQNTVNNSTIENNNTDINKIELKYLPGSKVSLVQILKDKNLTQEQAYNLIGNHLLRIQDVSQRQAYIKAFKRIWKQPRYRDDLLKFYLSIDSRGYINWTKSIKNYIDSISI